jgi:hypothetical protein
MHSQDQTCQTDKCPVCEHIVEINWHVFSCPKCSLRREELLCTLGDTLANNHTQPNLALMLIQGI